MRSMLVVFVLLLSIDCQAEDYGIHVHALNKLNFVLATQTRLSRLGLRAHVE